MQISAGEQPDFAPEQPEDLSASLALTLTSLLHVLSQTKAQLDHIPEETDWLNYHELVDAADESPRSVHNHLINEELIGWRTPDRFWHVPRAQFSEESFELNPVIRGLWDCWSRGEGGRLAGIEMFWTTVNLLDVPNPALKENDENSSDEPATISLLDFISRPDVTAEQLPPDVKNLFTNRQKIYELVSDPQLLQEFKLAYSDRQLIKIARGEQT